MDPAVRALWSRTKVLLRPESIRLLSFPPGRLAAVAGALATISSDGFVALLRERDEVSVAVPEVSASPFEALGPVRSAGPLRAITLDLDVDLSVSGYLLPAAAALAGARIPIVPLCGFRKDHLLVHEGDADRAREVLEGLTAG